MMSSNRTAHSKILSAALSLIRRRGGADVSLGEIARAAKVSRQAIYLNFIDRGDLMVALAKHIDEERGLEEKLLAIREAPTGVAAMQEMVKLQATDNPLLWPIARVFDAIRRSDADVEKLWQDRLENRLKGCREMVARLSAEKTLRRGLESDAATDLLWTITSLRMWEDLVLQRGWSAELYQEHVNRLLIVSLTNLEES